MKFIPLILFLLLCIFLWQGLKRDPHQLPSPFINKPLPYFSLPELMNSKKFDSTELQGHISLLNVFASWCISCKVEHAVLREIASGKTVLLYGLDYKDSRETIIKWLKAAGNPYQKIGFDESGNTAINLGVYGTPETFLIDQQGIIRYKHIGPITEEVWQAELKPEVEKRSTYTTLVQNIYNFKTIEQQARFDELTQKFRCLVCQNQSLAESNAPLAQDLRAQIFEMINANKNDREINDYLIHRYGDFISYQPAFKPITYLLWIMPVVLLLGGVYLVRRLSS